MTERIGVFGGTFDPPHLGHVAAARAARRAARLDRVLLVVAGEPWQKTATVVAAPEQRLAMTELAVSDAQGAMASRIEIDRPGPSYTVDTLDALGGPGRDLVLVLGADAAADIDTWHESERLLGLAELAVLPRTGIEIDRGIPIEMEPVDISSSDIRDRVRAGGSIAGLVPAGVEAYIRDAGIYV